MTDMEKMCILSYYEELSVLDASGEVLLVRHRETGEIFVKKVKQVYDLAVYQRIKEYPVAGVPLIYECFEMESKLYLIEEYIHGKCLQNLWEQQGNLSEELVIMMSLQLCDILKKLHQMEPPVIHRDIKPSNLILTNDHHLKLIDFNVAKEYHSGQTEDTVFLGTHDFAAPEQYGFGQSDARTDIYGMGVTMNYLLTGTFPKIHIWKGALGDVIRCCTEVDAKQRYATADELAAAISRCEVQTGSKAEKQRKNHENMQNMQEETGIRSWLPPGFRSGQKRKMAAAVFGYWFLVSVTLEAKFQSQGVPLTGMKLAINRLAMFLMLLGTAFLWWNYRGIQQKLPGLRRGQGHRLVRLLLLGAYAFLYMTCCIAILTVLESVC